MAVRCTFAQELRRVIWRGGPIANNKSLMGLPYLLKPYRRPRSLEGSIVRRQEGIGHRNRLALAGQVRAGSANENAPRECAGRC
jgi:hypothetical protein